jgi:hypothetical protein
VARARRREDTGNNVVRVHGLLAESRMPGQASVHCAGNYGINAEDLNHLAHEPPRAEAEVYGRFGPNGPRKSIPITLLCNLQRTM